MTENKKKKERGKIYVLRHLKCVNTVKVFCIIVVTTSVAKNSFEKNGKIVIHQLCNALKLKRAPLALGAYVLQGSSFSILF